MRSTPHSIRSRWRYGVLTLPVILSGCMAVETVQGESTVFSQSPLVTLVIGLGGLAFLVIGVGASVEALPYALQTAAAKRKGRKGGPKRKNGIAQILVGGLMAAIGLALVTYGVPSTLMSSVTVGPDSITLKHGSILFLSSTKKIPYDSISGFNVEEIDTRGFKGRKQIKRILHLSHSGGHERIEMNSMHIAAMPKLEEAYAAFSNRDPGAALVAADAMPENLASLPMHMEHSDTLPSRTGPVSVPNTGIPEGQTSPAGVTFSPSVISDSATGTAVDTSSTPATEGLTPITNLGRLQSGQLINVRSNGAVLFAEIQEVFAERKLRVRYPREASRGEELIEVGQVASVQAEILDSQATPPGVRIEAVTEIAMGDILLAQHGSQWYPVEVLAIQPPDRVRVTWIDEPRGNHSIPLAWCCRVPAAGVLPPAVAGTPTGAVAKAPSSPDNSGRGIAAGQKMEAFWGNKWYPVEILSVGKDGKIRIHYIGYADSWDTDVEPDKLRPLTAAKPEKK